MTDFSASRSRTIIGAARFHGRVRDGIGWFPRARVARRKGGGGAMRRGGTRTWRKAPGRGWVLADQAARSISTGRLHALPRVHRHAYPRGGLPRTLRSLKDSGALILGGASRLDAFSGYPVRTWLPGDALGRTTGTPEVRPFRSSRTRNSSFQITYAHSG